MRGIRVCSFVFLALAGASISAAPIARTGPIARAAQDSFDVLDHATLATSFLSENGQEEWASAGPAGRHFVELLDGPVFVRLEIGALDLRVSRKGLQEAEAAEEFRETVAAMVEMQSTWSDWQTPQHSTELAADWKTLAKWVKSWSPGKLAHADGGISLYESMGANDSVRGAAERLRVATKADDETCQALGERGQILLATNRREFFQVLSVAGWLDESLRASFWSPGVLERTIEWLGWTQIVCMEYTTLPLDPEKPFQGVDMSADEKNGRTQYMAERGAALLLRRKFWRQDAHFFEQSLATSLVVAAAGTNNLRSGEWKLEHTTSGASTQPYERFVPGGNPNGGTLPPNPAGPGVSSGNMTELSSYRRTKGADYFLGPLREGQQAGAKLAAKDKDHRLEDDKTAHFALHCLRTREDHAITAPFLGELAEQQPLPPLDFLDDYEDFFRAYRSGFVHWLQSKAMPSEEESQAKFAELLKAHAENPPHSPIDTSVEKVYGVPISHTDGTQESLEWRYLRWLAKKK